MINQTTKRISVKVAGESGQGINVVGGLLSKMLKNSGYHIFASREYPSLIKGGFANYQIDISGNPINSSSNKCDLLVCMSRKSIHSYLETLRPNGTLLHNLSHFIPTPEEKEFIEKNKIYVEFVDAVTISKDLGGNLVTSNMVLFGIICKILDLDLTIAKALIDKEFADKPKFLEIDHKCLEAGYAKGLVQDNISISFAKDPALSKSKLITGNYTLSLGAINAGVRAIYAYPMTPASSILSYLAKVSHKTGMLIKQAEDEITASQMALGSMHMGTRAFTATSGGGFDLMTETISMAGMIETPFVVVLAQRPGPATGLPTWTSSGDLNLALYSGHGEFPRIVIAASDAQSAFTSIQHAFNLAEKYQTAVIVLTEKQIAESLFQVQTLPDNLPIERSLPHAKTLHELTSDKRYELTKSGVSTRWLPGTSQATYNANSDEHNEDGTVNESAFYGQAMASKRMRKLDSILAEIPDPKVFGEMSGDIGFIGWGSPKNAVLDAILETDSPLKINYLHYEYVFPLKTTVLKEFIAGHKKIVLIENNYLGQLGELITSKTGYVFENKLLKYDGRPFFVEDLLNYINTNS